MERYTALTTKEKTGRRAQGQANYVYIRYADDFVILSNGTKEQAEELKEEVHNFLKGNLKLKLSLEKTKITHLNDGFNFLGFKIQRKQGHNGMKTKVLIPKEAVDRVKDKVAHATDKASYNDSVNSTILALNRIIGGWCRYYQYTSKASSVFNDIEHFTFWKLAHWLGRKFKIEMPETMRRYNQGNVLHTKEYHLIKAYEFPTRIYKKNSQKPNPYTTQEKITREELPGDLYWTGYETRPGMVDLRPFILRRDEYTCQKCGVLVIPQTAEVDHKRPVRRFRRPVDANRLENLQTVCKIPCHRNKTEYDRQMESPVR